MPPARNLLQLAELHMLPTHKYHSSHCMESLKVKAMQLLHDAQCRVMHSTQCQLTLAGLGGSAGTGLLVSQPPRARSTSAEPGTSRLEV